MKKTILIILVILLNFNALTVQSQVETLSPIGQTPGGGGYVVDWDEENHKLIVGCGVSIWIYDMTDPYNPVKVQQRPLLGQINETELDGDVLFVAATHDGVYALDYTKPDLDILDHFSMKEMQGVAAYGMHLYNDTIYVADNSGLRVLTFSNLTGFTDHGVFGFEKAFGVHRRGDHIAVCYQQIPLVSEGKVRIFSVNDLSTPLAEWTSPWINWVQAIQFADLRDDIIYVCGGPETPVFDKSNFFALQFDGNELVVLDTFSVVNGVPGFAQQNIINMDSRNDTIFIATTAAWDITHLPYTYIPVLDATQLPDNKMEKIGKVSPMLWHFDVALMHGTPYAAMSSEWLGVLVSDVSELAFFDTVRFIPTGGWVNNSRVKDNQLWVCSEGYGLVVYDIDSLLYEHGFNCDSKILYIQSFEQNEHFFSSDVEFLNDTLIMLNTSDVYNIKPWQQGGNPELVYHMGKSPVKMKNIHTNLGQRIVASFTILINHWIEVFDPFDEQNNFESFFVDTTGNDYSGFTVSNDTLYYGVRHGTNRYLMAAKVENDEVNKLDSIQLSMPWGLISWHDITGISVENGIIAVSYGKQIAAFHWNNGKLEELFHDYYFNRMAVDIVLRNSYVYVADKFFGMKIYDISTLSEAVQVAEFRGTGGWMNVFGSQSLSVANDGRIYLNDFIGGVIIIEAFDDTPSSIDKSGTIISNEYFTVYPNPANDQFTIMISGNNIQNTGQLIIYDILGQEVLNRQINSKSEININTSEWISGIYLVKVICGKLSGTEKVMIK